MGISHAFHNVRRIRQILRVLVKYGFGYFVERLNIDRGVLGKQIFRLKSLRRAEHLELSTPVRLRLALEELGPTFIKLGQVLSLRPDLVSSRVSRELEKLQDQVPGIGHEAIEAEVTREFGKELAELFSSFSPEPLACASLAQVHAARLPGGETVIVKVQRPGIAEVIETDIEILYELARLAVRYLEESRLFNPVAIVDEFRNTITRELDFLNESFNVDRFREHFKDAPTVYIPRVFHELTTKKVMVMEKVEGVKVTDIPGLMRAGLDLKQIAKNGADAILKQVFLYGVFHADPHPGNLLVLADNRVAFLDYGMVGRLSRAMKGRLGDILISVVRRDVPGIREAILALGRPETEVDLEKLDFDLEDFMERYYDKPLRELNIGQVTMNLLNIVSYYRVRLPPDLFLLSKVLITIESIGRTLDPDFNMVDQARPFVEELQRQRYAPRAVARELRAFARTLFRFTRALPRDLSVIFNKLKAGTLKVEFEHRGLERLGLQIDKASSRIAFSLIIAALLVGSSIIMQADRGPQYLGFPVLGLVCFVVAAIMGIWLAIVILSSGRL
ncbi:MAG: ABC1 kinase family protein [Endomicrobiales bacterium]